MTSDIPQYFNPQTFGSIDVTQGKLKLPYLKFGKGYKDGWPLYESQIFSHFSWTLEINH